MREGLLWQRDVFQEVGWKAVRGFNRTGSVRRAVFVKRTLALVGNHLPHRVLSQSRRDCFQPFRIVHSSLLTSSRFTFHVSLTPPQLAGLRDLLRRQLHLVRQRLGDGDLPPRHRWARFQPLFKIVLVDKESLLEAPSGSPLAIRSLLL